MKQIVVSGNIGKDAVLRQTQRGDSVAGFTVAVEERQGQDKRTLWFDVSLWGKRGEALCQYLSKGTKVSVAGELSTREHEGKTYLTIRADQVTLMGGGQRDGGQQGQSQQGSYGGGPAGGLDDEIPFAPEVRI